MGAHSMKRRRGAALAKAGAAIAGGGLLLTPGSAAAIDVIDVVPVDLDKTYVEPDLAPFTNSSPPADNRGGGAAEISEEFGAPTGGGDAALRLSTPAGSDKVQVLKPESDTPLADFIGKASYSAYQGSADNPIQFPSYQLVLDYNGDAEGGFTTLTYEPIYNEGTDRTAEQWNSYDVGNGLLCSTRAVPGIVDESQRQCSNGGVNTIADYAEAAPDAVVKAVQINQGSGNPGLESAVDLVETPETTYDFELEAPPVVLPPVDPPVDPTDPTDPVDPTDPPKDEDPVDPPKDDEDGKGDEDSDDGDWDAGHEDDDTDGHGKHCGCPQH